MMPCLAAVRPDDLRDWLLFAPIQPPHGPHRGGVAGWLDEAGRPAFVYGEITGYLLTCGRFIARHHDGVALRRRVDGAVAWLDAVWRDAPPPTRHYLGPAEPDWRNEAVFSFDGAMIVRGLSGLGTESARRTRAAVANTLLGLVGPDGTLRTHVPRANAGALPERWSTTAGPFQLKTAAAILSAETTAPLRAAAEATARRWIDWYPAHELTGELHPLLYHLEGLLLLGGARAESAPRWRLAAEIFDEIMARQRSDGDLPSSFSDERAEPRSDVTAQALRIGTLLVEAGYLPGRRLRRLGGLADALRGYADPSGGVRFRRADPAQRHVNVWCTVFAYQALALFERACEGAAIDERVIGTIA